MTISQLNLNGGDGQAAQVRMGQGDQAYTMGAKKTGFFINYQDEDVISITPAGNVIMRAEHVVAKKVRADSLHLAGVAQWSMVALENFNAISPYASGWFAGDYDTPTVNCSGLVIMTGVSESLKVPNMDSFAKTYEHLAPHTQVQIKATVHFLDDWQGETAFMKIDNAVVWTEMHDQRATRGTFNVCGRSFPDSKFSVPISVTISHSKPQLRVSFGSTLDSTAFAYFGLSSLELYIRDTSRVPVTP